VSNRSGARNDGGCGGTLKTRAKLQCDYDHRHTNITAAEKTEYAAIPFTTLAGSRDDCRISDEKEPTNPARTNQTRTQVLPRTEQNQNPNVIVFTRFFH